MPELLYVFHMFICFIHTLSLQHFRGVQSYKFTKKCPKMGEKMYWKTKSVFLFLPLRFKTLLSFLDYKKINIEMGHILISFKVVFVIVNLGRKTKKYIALKQLHVIHQLKSISFLLWIFDISLMENKHLHSLDNRRPFSYSFCVYYLQSVMDIFIIVPIIREHIIFFMYYSWLSSFHFEVTCAVIENPSYTKATILKVEGYSCKFDVKLNLCIKDTFL